MAYKVSIIVPVFRAENYLHRCLDSIVSQTLKDWECILVDDGSPDKSGAICDEYAQSDDRFVVVHKSNGGVSSARQLGIDCAKGEYTIHVDPDDWCEPTMLEELYQKAVTDNADMVICDFYLNTKNSQEYSHQTPNDYSSIGIMRQIIEQKIHGSLCNKLIRKECYTRNNVRIPDHLIMWEDLYVCCSILQHDIAVIYLPKAFYHYDRFSNVGSITRRKSTQKAFSKKWVADYWINNAICAINQIDLYAMKKDVKMSCFFSKALPNSDIVQLYNDINERFLSETHYSLRTPLQNAMKLLLSGHCQWFINIYYSLHSFLLSIYSSIMN